MKIILWDIESAPILATTWSLFEPQISHERVIEPTSMICAAWKVLGEREVHTAAISPKTPRNDLALVKTLRAALAQADVIVAHNGDKFDLKLLNARLVYHGLEPLPPVKTIDTYKVAKKHFRFDSNRLDYLGNFLGCGRKIHTDYHLWLRILFNHDKAALAAMLRYNQQDVRLLESVYKKLRPYMNNHPNSRLTDGDACPICAVAGALQKRGWRLNRKSKAQAYQCQSCAGWSTGPAIATTKIA